MIPQPVAETLKQLPPDFVAKRLIHDGDRRTLELGPEDEELRLRLGVETDKLGPAKVVVLWDEGGSLQPTFPLAAARQASWPRGPCLLSRNARRCAVSLA